MLLNIHVKNIALIDEIDINLREGLNILTGETGAGKSIIIGSLGICLGGKFSKDLLRDESKDGLVELMFSVESQDVREELSALDIYPDEEDVLLISRRINGSGKTINRINDNTVTIGKLKEVAAVLIDLHAQHEQQTLLKVSKHIEILDRFGGEEVASLKEEVSKLYAKYVDIKTRLKADELDETAKNKQVDFLKYQIDEIQSAGLKPGEDDELESLYKKIVNSKDIMLYADEVYQATGYNGPSSAGDMLGHSLGIMKRAAELDSDLNSCYETLVDIDSMLSDFNRELSQYMKGMEFDEEEFKTVESRLDLINTLKAKYGKTLDAVLNSLEAYKVELDKLSSYEEYIEGLKKELATIENDLLKSSEALSIKRKAVADNMCNLIKASLCELNFSAVDFEMRFERNDKFSSSGYDYAEFYICTNVGEDMRPLSQVASGGELSRIMLALKSCIANLDATPTLVFDEIDVGISGRTAQLVAEKLSLIAKNHQVICITHLPQIAAMADAHYVIEKNVENNKTLTSIRGLNREEEIGEIARLIGGAMITEATIASAEEMKGLADRTKIY